jgi:hypothetical protein
MTQLTIYINQAQDLVKTLGKGVFLNIYNFTYVTIGAVDQLSYFEGFLYFLTFDTSGVLHNSRLLASCSFPINGTCLPVCPINSY